ncbi:MAG: acyltransferase [Synergistaceae bacterium]|nr:acyltransferase [Synergistaceae bacterium]
MTEQNRTSSFVDQKLESIQVLRGVAALVVLLLHGTYSILPGNFGVDIFFCISGFIMVYVTQKSAKDFFIKRVIRVVPLYWYTTLQRFVLLQICFRLGIANPDRRDLRCFVSSLFFLPINGAPMQSLAWSLYYEMAFYAVFAVACIISIKYRSVIAFIGLLAIVGIGAVWEVDYLMFLELAGGMGAFYLTRWLYGQKNTYGFRLAFGIVAVASFVALALTEKFILFENTPRFVRYGIPAFVFVVSFVKATQRLEMPRSFVFFGDVSFSLYLIQLDVFAVLKGALIFLGIVPSFELFIGEGFIIEKIATTTIGIGLIFAVSLVTYNLIEKRFTNYLKVKMLRKAV